MLLSAWALVSKTFGELWLVLWWCALGSSACSWWCPIEYLRCCSINFWWPLECPNDWKGHKNWKRERNDNVESFVCVKVSALNFWALIKLSIKHRYVSTQEKHVRRKLLMKIVQQVFVLCWTYSVSCVLGSQLKFTNWKLYKRRVGEMFWKTNEGALKSEKSSKHTEAQSSEQQNTFYVENQWN